MSTGPGAMDRHAVRHGWVASPDHAAAQPRVAVIPCGAVEQHGPHLPVATDIWLASEMAAAAAAGRPRVLVAEPLSYGCSGHHTGFPGTIALQVSTFVGLVVDVATSLHRDGYIAVFLNGHGGNRAPLAAALQQLLDSGVEAWALSYFDVLAEELAATLHDSHGSVGHACAMETSLIMHLWPSAVHADRIPAPGAQHTWPDPFLFSKNPIVHPRRFEQLDPTGVVGAPDRATGEIGARLHSVATARIGEYLDAILANAVEAAARPGPVSTRPV